MTKEHWMLLAGVLAVAGGQIATLTHWQEGISPAFIGGTLLQLAITLRACFTEKPQ